MIEIALIAQVSLWLIVLGVLFWSRQASVFHPAMVYLAFHGLVFVLRPILVYYFGFDSSWVYMEFKPSDEIFVKTLAVSSVGMMCLVGVGLLVGRSRTQFFNPSPPTFSLAQRRALLVTTLLLLPAIACSIYATRAGVAGERVGGIYIMTNSTGYVNEAQDFIMPLLVAWIIVTRFHWLNLFPAFIYVAYRTWYGWSRWTILLFFLLLVISYCWYYRRKWLPLWAIAAAVPVFILFNLLGHNRDLLKSALTGKETHVAEFAAGLSPKEKIKAQYDTQEFANFDFLTYVIWAVPYKTKDYSYGAQYIELFTDPIPRILWRGKPVGSPVNTINPFAYGNFTGLTVTLVGDAWISGGWIGVIFELSFLGALLGLAHRAFWRNTNNSMGCVFYLVVVAILPQWYRDGGVISPAKFISFNIAPLLVWWAMTWLLSKRLLNGYTVMLPAGSRVRILQAGAGADQKAQP